jgi:hypothetical protein
MSVQARLAELDALAGARFPGDSATLRPFFDELGRALAAPDGARDAAQLLVRLEDFLEALLVRERWRQS